MGYVNLPPSLQALIDGIVQRLTKLENGQRFTLPNTPVLTTQPTVTGLATNDPTTPRTGDVWLNTTDNTAKYVDTVGAVQTLTTGAQLAVGYRPNGRLVFTSGGSFVKGNYSWLRAVRVVCVGAGGGGGGAAATSGTQMAIGGSGSGGGYSEAFITNLATLSATMYAGVSAGGSGGSAGANAGATAGWAWFGPSNVDTTGALVVANGGIGGAAGATSSNTATVVASVAGASVGTVPTANDWAVPGGASTAVAAFQASNTAGTAGGASVYGFGGAAVSGGSTAGNAGVGYGSGGSGAANGQSATAKAGGAGAPGLVILELFA